MNNQKRRQGRRNSYFIHTLGKQSIDWRVGANDHHYLQLAYSLGGACVVSRPEVRASMQRAGLMEPAPFVNLGLYWRTDRNSMRLTKRGRLRALQLCGGAGRPDRSCRKYQLANYNRAINRQ